MSNEYLPAIRDRQRSPVPFTWGLERQTKRQLHDARIERARDLSEVTGDLSSGLIPLRAGSDAAELGVVEHVVGLRLETKVDPLADFEVLEQREVGVIEARASREGRGSITQRQ